MDHFWLLFFGTVTKRDPLLGNTVYFGEAGCLDSSQRNLPPHLTAASDSIYA